VIHLLLLLLCFFASGAAALLYQTAWTREFTTVFGTSELAISAVLAAYMAGLAAGAALAGRLAQRIRRPVLAYGALELGIGVGALAVPLGIQAIRALYVSSFGGLEALPEGESLARTLFHVAGAFAVLMPCAALMGATLPLLARHAVREDRQIGPRVGLLYAMNTAGAIAGTVCAGFWLLPAIGLRNTVYVGVVINVLVFLAAALLARGAAPVSAGRTVRAESGARWILVAMMFSGMVSFSYEVLWTRLLGQLIGGSTPAFSTMLASFLLGIALGSAVAARFARSARSAALGFALAQLGAAAFGWLAFALADELPAFSRLVGASAFHPELGALVAVAVLLPMTLCFGATFPFAVRLHARSATDAGASSARVYAWNTVGSILGAVCAGLWFLPVLGFGGTVALGVATNLVLCVLSSTATGSALRGISAAAVAGLLLLALFRPQAPHELLMNAPLGGRRMPGELVYLGVGRSSTVVLSRLGPRWRLSTNGLPEASIEEPDHPPGIANETGWLALAPALARPAAERLLLIGLGGGATLSEIPPSFQHIEVVELEPRVLEANRLATPRRGGDPLDDPRVRVHVGDARGALLLSPTRYDAIVSQPSHPWTSGASHLYTKEFFELARDHLTRDGVLVQWMGSMFVTPSLLRSLLATLLDVFPHVEALRPDPTALVLVASGQPLDISAAARGVLSADASAFAAAGIARIEDVAATRALTTEGVKSVAGDARLLTDDHNPLGSGLRPGLRPTELDSLLAPYDSLQDDWLEGSADDLDLTALLRRLAVMNHSGRIGALFEHLDEPQRQAARGWLAHERGQPETAALHFERSLELDPSLAPARLGLLVNGRSVDESIAPLSPEEALLQQAARAGSAGSWQAVRELDEPLSGFAVSHLAFPEAARLRVDWRLASGSAAHAVEAFHLVDSILLTGWRAGDLLRRARAAAQAERSDLAWSMLDIAAQRVPGNRVKLRREALAFSQTLPEHPDAGRIRDALRRRRTRPTSEFEGALEVDEDWAPTS
jgi:spermidine synthase